LLMPGSVSPNTVTVSYIGGTNNTTSGTSFTFTNHAIGTANANRRVVVVAYANDGAGNTITGITIGGNAASIDAIEASIDQGSIAIASLPVASGTTATIAVTVNVSSARCRIEVYAVTGNLSIPARLDSDVDYKTGSSAATVTLDVAAGAGVVAGVGTDGVDRTYSWTNLTKDNEANSGHLSRDMSVASTNVASGSSLAVTVAPSGSVAKALVAASYQ